MIGRHVSADQTEGCGQPLEHVDFHAEVVPWRHRSWIGLSPKWAALIRLKRSGRSGSSSSSCMRRPDTDDKEALARRFLPLLESGLPVATVLQAIGEESDDPRLLKASTGGTGDTLV